MAASREGRRSLERVSYTISGSNPSWTALRGPGPHCDVVAPKVGRPEIAEDDLGRFVRCLPHEVGETRAAIAGRGSEPGT